MDATTQEIFWTGAYIGLKILIPVALWVLACCLINKGVG